MLTGLERKVDELSQHFNKETENRKEEPVRAEEYVSRNKKHTRREVPVQDGDTGRPTSPLLHGHTKSTLIYEAAPPEEVRADRTVSAQHKIGRRRKKMAREAETGLGGEPPYCALQQAA